MNKHYFVGIPIPPDVARDLAETRDSWSMQSHKVYSASEDMHITLLFIGSASEKLVNGLIHDLTKLEKSGFSLTVKGIETFGNPSTPRVVYASLEDEPALFELHKEIVGRAKRNGLNGDLKPLVPHITLAKKWAGGEPLRIDFEVQPVSFQVTSFSVFEIQPRHHPKYIPVSTIKLKGETR